MADFQMNTQLYDLDAAHALDFQDACITVDVGSDKHGMGVTSLKHLDREIDLYILSDKERVKFVNKLYVVGEWNFSFDVDEAAAEASDSWTIIDKLEESYELLGFDVGGEYMLTTTKVRTVTRQENEWNEGVAKVCELIKEMENLKELTWVSTLPFTEAVWSVLPSTSLDKLVLDIGNPVRLEPTDFDRKTYISQESMKPMVKCAKLKELRLFSMRDSFQSIVWETVFRNESDNKGMNVLDLQMADPPLVRQENWIDATNVTGLTVAVDENEEYLGLEGKGILHHAYGTGEYLDDFCMRKARLASGLDEMKPLPLWCLKLDGFVVDELPFMHELSRIVLLTCGNNCVDAGLRAPKTARPHNKWSDNVKDVVTHCRIEFPNWTGIFDAGGLQRDRDGTLMDQEGVQNQREERNDQVVDAVAAATNSFSLLNLWGTANTVSADNYSTPSATASNASVRGSPVPDVRGYLGIASPIIKPAGSVDLDALFGDNTLEQDPLDAASNATTVGSETLVPSDSLDDDVNAQPKSAE